jgi:hypothetical protein
MRGPRRAERAMASRCSCPVALGCCRSETATLGRRKALKGCTRVNQLCERRGHTVRSLGGRKGIVGLALDLAGVSHHRHRVRRTCHGLELLGPEMPKEVFPILAAKLRRTDFRKPSVLAALNSELGGG